MCRDTYELFDVEVFANLTALLICTCSMGTFSIDLGLCVTTINFVLQAVPQLQMVAILTV